ILNSKTKDILLFKDFRENENHLKIQIFIMELNKILAEEKSPYIRINDTIFIYLQENGIIFLSLISEDNLTNSIYTILLNIHKTLVAALGYDYNSDLFRDNFVEIALMIDQYLVNGVP